MPIYEYHCQSCGHEMEALQKISDAPLVECPECRESALKKKISAAAFRLKGGGWYETDFKKSGTKRNIAGDSEKPAGDKGKAGDKKADGNKGSGKKTESAPTKASGND